MQNRTRPRFALVAFAACVLTVGVGLTLDQPKAPEQTVETVNTRPVHDVEPAPFAAPLVTAAPAEPVVVELPEPAVEPAPEPVPQPAPTTTTTAPRPVATPLPQPTEHPAPVAEPELEPVDVTPAPLPRCPEVTYDGNLDGPGPQWSELPTEDCVGPGHVNLSTMRDTQ